MSLAAQPSDVSVDTIAPFDTERLLADIAYMGALYGLNEQSRAVLKHLAGAERTRKAANIGEALNLITTRNYVQAAQILEKQIETDSVPTDIAQMLLVLSCRLGSFAQARADDILQRLDASPSSEVREFASKMREI